MHYSLLLAGLLLLAPPALAQTAEAPADATALRAQPHPDDNTIVLTLPDEGRAAWQRAGRLLARRGYPIRYASPELLTLSTEVIVGQDRSLMGIILLVDGHEMRLQAYIPRGDSSSPITWFNPTKQSRGRGSDGQRWQELEAIARLLGGTVQYTRSISY